MAMTLCDNTVNFYEQHYIMVSMIRKAWCTIYVFHSHKRQTTNRYSVWKLPNAMKSNWLEYTRWELSVWKVVYIAANDASESDPCNWRVSSCDGPRCRSSKFVHKFISILSTWRGWRRRQHTSMMAVTATQFTGVSNTIVERCVLKCRSKAITVVCRCCGVCTLCFIHIQRHLIFIYFWAFFLSFLVFFSS